MNACKVGGLVCPLPVQDPDAFCILMLNFLFPQIVNQHVSSLPSFPRRSTSHPPKVVDSFPCMPIDESSMKVAAGKQQLGFAFIDFKIARGGKGDLKFPDAINADKKGLLLGRTWKSCPKEVHMSVP